MTRSDSDEELILAYKNGDQEALKNLIEKYTPPIYNFVRRLGAKDESDDITQEVFLKVWKHLGRFDAEKARFKTWIFTIARNTVTDFLRKSGFVSGGKKAVTFSDFESGSEEDSFSETIPDTALLPDEALQKVQDARLLSELLDNLPENYRTVLVLYYQEEMTFAEIGEVLNKPLHTVKSQHRRALIKLRNMLQ